MNKKRNVLYYEFGDDVSKEEKEKFFSTMNSSGWDFYNSKNLCFSYGLEKVMTLQKLLDQYSDILFQTILIRADDSEISFV
jgi:hypothetical protein